MSDNYWFMVHNMFKVIFTSMALGKITWKFSFRNTVVQQGKDALAFSTVPISQATGNSAGTSKICLGKIWKIACLWVWLIVAVGREKNCKSGSEGRKKTKRLVILQQILSVGAEKRSPTGIFKGNYERLAEERPGYNSCDPQETFLICYHTKNGFSG